MKSFPFTLILVIGLALSLVVLARNVSSYRLPGNQQGYEPRQPIAFSHRLHANELKIDCQYCHYAADNSRYAGIPPANLCMNCHKFVTATLGTVQEEAKVAQKEKRERRPLVSPELRKLYDALALNEKMEPDPQKSPQPIAWARIHQLPDFVYFDHRPHVTAGVTCDTCHGDVQTMERMRQVESLSMGWCVNCHRSVNRTGVAGQSVNASVDCTTCHY